MICILLSLLVMSPGAFAQDRVIQGKVISAEEGLPLPGVNIVCKGTNVGTVTDAEGKYSLLVPRSSPFLIFSFVGMETTEVEVGERSVLDISMAADIKHLGEVVITALGLLVDRDKVGTASTNISGSQVTNSGEPTLINGMSGKSSGLIISRTSGDPGSGSYIQIRGQSSISNSVQPLIVVDGIPVYNSNFGTGAGGIAEQSRLNDLNPNDIESIEVLKGAGASALWGTRAGNGVIMITTKKGTSRENKVHIEYSGTYSIDKLLTKHPLQNTYGQGSKGVYITNALGDQGHPNSFGDKIANRSGGPDSVLMNSGYFQTLDGKVIYPIAENGGKRSTETFDPYKAVFGTGQYFDQTLSISSGNPDGNYYISVGDLSQKGIIKNNSTYRRTSFRVNSEKQLTEWLRVASSLAYTRTKQEGILYGNTTAALMVGMLRTPPDWNNAQGYEGVYFDPSGKAFINRQLSYRNQIGRNQNPGYDNPVWSMHHDRNTTEVNRFIGSVQLQGSPLSWLTFTLRSGADHYSNYWETYFSPGGVAGSPAGSGVLAISTERETQFNFDGFAEGRFKIIDNLNARFLLGFNANERAYDEVGGAISNFTIKAKPPLSLDNAVAASDDPFNAFRKIRAAAIYGTTELDFMDQLFVGLTGRMENSSVFSHTNNPILFYPSITANWHPFETFGVRNRMLTFAKLRAGFGVVSTIPGPYNTITYWSPATFGDGFVGLNARAASYGGGYQQSVLQGNGNLRPETKTEMEGGFDLRLLSGMISLSATYFANTIRDAIIPVEVAGSTGFTRRTDNAAQINNKGLEIDMSGDVVRAGKFTLNTYGNWTRIRNRVTYLGGSEVVTFSGGALGEGSAVVGHPVGIHFGYTYGRNENGYILRSDGFPDFSATPTVVGDPNPDWRMAIGTKLIWKNLSLNVLVEHSHGGQMWGGTRGALIAFGTHKDTEREVILSYEQAGSIKNASGLSVIDYGYNMNPDSTFTVRGYLTDFGGGTVLVDEEWWKTGGGGFGGPLAAFMEPAQWTKLREVSLTYSLNGKTFKRVTKLRSIDFSVTGRNLFLWTQFKGNDPETNLRGPANTRGRDYFNNPATRSFLFTVRISY